MTCMTHDIFFSCKRVKSTSLFHMSYITVTLNILKSILFYAALTSGCNSIVYSNIKCKEEDETCKSSAGKFAIIGYIFCILTFILVYMSFALER